MSGFKRNDQRNGKSSAAPLILLGSFILCCGVENRIPHSCFFQPPGTFSASLRQICERKEENAAPIFNFPGIFCRLKDRASPVAQQGGGGGIAPGGGVIPGVSQHPKIGASCQDTSALGLCCTIPEGLEQRVPARSCSR